MKKQLIIIIGLILVTVLFVLYRYMNTQPTPSDYLCTADIVAMCNPENGETRNVPSICGPENKSDDQAEVFDAKDLKQRGWVVCE